MTAFLRLHGQQLTALTIGIVIVVGVQLWLDGRQASQSQEAQTLLALELAEQELILQQLSDTTRRGVADAVTNSVIIDCTNTERQRLDALLNGLTDSLSSAELLETESLFNKCASVSADRKAVMAARLMREVEVYESLRDMLTVYGELPEEERARSSAWRSVAEQEQLLATRFRELVKQQGDIIALLKAGRKRDAEEIQTILKEVQDVRNLIIISNQQLDTTRQTLERI